MSAVKILIVEDEVVIADHLMDTLEDLGYEVAEPCLTYSSAVASIKAGTPDLAILDIQLSGRKTGIDLAHLINEEYHFPFIFLTSNSDQETLEAAKIVAPAAFLVKPYSKEDLFTAIEVGLYNYAQRRKKALDEASLVIKDALFIKEKKAFLRVNFKDILYIESSHIYLDIVSVSGKKYTIRSSFNELMGKLSDRFERVHRSYIINLDYLGGINSGHVMVGEVELPVSKAHRDKIMKGILKG